MDKTKFVPQSNIPLSTDPQQREDQYAYVVRRLNDFAEVNSKPLTIEEYKQYNKLTP